MTKRAPCAREITDLRFAFRIVKHVKSNAIVYAKDGATVGIGAGQITACDSSRIAAWKAAEAARLAGLPESLARGRSSPPMPSSRLPTASSLLPKRARRR